MAGTSRLSTNLLRAGAIGLAALGGTGLVLATGVASADPAPTPRKITGNVTTCGKAGLTGEILFGTGKANPAAGSGTIISNGTTLKVTISAGYTASGVVVKGGPDTHVYDGPFVGATTVEGMVSPHNPGGNIPQISHWFVCGGKSATTSPGATTKPPTTKPPTTQPTPSESPAPSESPTVAPTAAPSGTPPTDMPATTVPPASPPPGGLPTTGTRIGLVVGSAAALIGAGGALVLLVRRRRRFEA